MNINIISIMNINTKERYTFTYFDDVETVRDIATLVYKDNYNAVLTTVQEFIKRKKELRRRAYFNYMQKVQKNSELGIVDRLHTKTGQKIDIMIFDEPKTLYKKYSFAWGIELDEKMKKNILENFNCMVDSILKDEILNPNKKVKKYAK